MNPGWTQETTGDCSQAGCGLGEPGPVCSKTAGRTPGPEPIYDLAGNVYEWVEGYANPATCVEGCTDPRFHEIGARPVVRGGSFCSPPGSLEAIYRGAVDLPQNTLCQRGIRCCWDPSMPAPADRHVDLGCLPASASRSP